ncbi:MAG: hypothetical protein FWF96_08035 [Kiritimatiellaeota bacterium]|nr:hypothetical protein [Kiritimatiellota bacterium]
MQEHNFATAEEYFTYLLSDGVTLVIAEPDRRLVPDLRPELLVLNNDKAAKIGGKVTPEANIWHVVVASSNTPRDTIFLVTRNVNASDIRYAESEDEIQNPETSTRMRLAKKLFPQIRRNAVWISRGGSSLHLPEEKLFPALVCPEVRPEGAPPLKTLPAAASMRHPPIRITTPGG